MIMTLILSHVAQQCTDSQHEWKQWDSTRLGATLDPLSYTGAFMSSRPVRKSQRDRGSDCSTTLLWELVLAGCGACSYKLFVVWRQPWHQPPCTPPSPPPPGASRAMPRRLPASFRGEWLWMSRTGRPVKTELEIEEGGVCVCVSSPDGKTQKCASWETQCKMGNIYIANWHSDNTHNQCMKWWESKVSGRRPSLQPRDALQYEISHQW